MIVPVEHRSVDLRSLKEANSGKPRVLAVFLTSCLIQTALPLMGEDAA
jgi:hypothetical protein